MTDHIIKWNDATGQYTAYCNDDKNETEIGPVKWSDANDRWELHCDGGVYPVKWNDATGRLEAQGVGAGCCGVLDCGSYTPPSSISVSVSGNLSCSGSSSCTNECKCADYTNGSHTLNFWQTSGNRHFWRVEYTDVCDEFEDAEDHTCGDATGATYKMTVVLTCSGANNKLTIVGGFQKAGDMDPNCFMVENGNAEYPVNPVIVSNDRDECGGCPAEQCGEDGTMTISGLWA